MNENGNRCNIGKMSSQLVSVIVNVSDVSIMAFMKDVKMPHCDVFLGWGFHADGEVQKGVIPVNRGPPHDKNQCDTDKHFGHHPNSTHIRFHFNL